MKIKICIFLLTLLIISIAPFIGYDGFLDFKTEEFILMNLRIPRVLLAFFIGGILSIIGWSYQILFKNPLATPYTLGISSVAALAMACAELFQLPKYMTFTVIYLPLIFLLIFSLKKNIARERILLFGVCLGIFSSSGIVFMQTLLGNESVARLVRWMMGGLDIVGFVDFYYLVPVTIGLLIIMFVLRKPITLISVSDEFARTRGVDTQRASSILLVVTSLSIAVVIFLCGPIGFVGLIIPHFVRKLVGVDFSKNAIFAFLAGGSFLVLCDLVSRSVNPDHVIPVGAITAVIGAPVLIFKIIRS